MTGQEETTDYQLAYQICRELRSGNRDALLVLYHNYQQLFVAFAKRRLFCNEVNDVDGLLTNFWIELLDGRSICRFRGEASLRTYLLVILNRRIIDANRRSKRTLEVSEMPVDAVGEPVEGVGFQETPEEELFQKENQRLFHHALEELSESSPRDADLIRMHLHGLTYEEMARVELAPDRADAGAIDRRADAIKKQFTRGKTGSLAKFKRIIGKTLEKNTLTHGDLMN